MVREPGINSASLSALIGVVILSLVPTRIKDSQEIFAASSAPLKNLLQALRSVDKTLFLALSNRELRITFYLLTSMPAINV